jgi:hypothetical protein
MVVKTERLDNLIAPRDQIVFAKIDVEGHEMAVLDGMTNIISSNECVLQIESLTFHQAGELKLDGLKTFLRGHGYRMIHQIGPDIYYSNH